ncbi:RluA family pseudouridine synthase [Lactobacillus sp. CBA3605]|uniref:RluA family pseudouridine synthase n=1 Tax=Lactobacillus sp. CBA3605 TaxID=2099788 RepID=UPI000CFC23E2|nr:RluA family pseudouridine synthase [Lactobacillus sp. CBA3605]AVK62082.1 RluA family pseudouridine synthase [Lactobacillus sp. CBA3605]
MQVDWRHTGESVSMKHFLIQHGISMRLIKAIKHGEGQFIVNQRVQTGVITIKTGEVAGIRIPDEAADPTVAVSTGPIAVIYADENWLVVNKPAGLTSVPGPSNRTDTLVNRVKGYLLATHAANQKPHLITRLDRDTSGLVLIAKHRIAQSMLTYAPIQATLTKTYLAWVSGQLTPTTGTISLPIGRETASPKRTVMTSGQPAVTKYWVLQTTAKMTQVKLQLVTGRTHQIRVHLTALGHPLLGDALYGGDQTLIERQALHAATLGFQDPFSDQRLTFTAPLPPDLQKLRV